MLLLRVSLKRLTAIVQIDPNSGKHIVLDCSNSKLCRELGIMEEFCPAYCEIIVAAKDYTYGRRRPKASIEEIEEKDLEFIRV